MLKNCFRTTTFKRKKKKKERERTRKSGNFIISEFSFQGCPQDIFHRGMLPMSTTTWDPLVPYTTAYPWGSNSSWMLRTDTSAAMQVAVFTGAPTGKKQTNIYILIFLKISSMEYSFLNRKQKTICYPKGGRTKMEMKGHCDILLCNSLSIYNHQEQGTWHYRLFKNT